jgi:hypothetical protein
VPQTALGVDVARGGKDKTVLTPRYANWFGEQICRPGASTPNGQAVVKLIIEHREGKAAINVDVIGIGTAPQDVAEMSGLAITPMNSAASSTAKDKSGQLSFVNRRAEWWWKLREALDPESGEDLAIPPDRELLADLTAPRWRLMARGIQIESKDEIKARIGRSPDKGESLLYAFANAGGAQGWVDFYSRLAAEARGEKPPVPKEKAPMFGFKRELPEPPKVKLTTTAHMNFAPATGVRYSADEHGVIFAAPEHVRALVRAGCKLPELPSECELTEPSQRAGP